MCAAPGGKTTQIAELMKNKGEIIAIDIYPHKVDLIEKNAKRLGIEIISARTGNSAEYMPEFAEKADKILCDVPCSGTGIIGRKPDIKRNRDTGKEPITNIQRKILDNASGYLKAGGEMVYSTCSIEKEENEGVTGGFIADNHNFEKIYEKTFYPNVDGTDGFYVCKMRKAK